MDLIIQIFLGLLFCISIFFNLFFLIEKQEREELILSYLQKIEDLKSRAIKLAKSLEEENHGNKVLVEKMKLQSVKNRIYKSFYYSYFKK